MFICLLLISGVPALFVGFVSSTQNSSGNEAFAQSNGFYVFSYCTCNGCGGASGYPNRGGQCLTFGGGCIHYSSCG